jgi:hypothetical protein
LIAQVEGEAFRQARDELGVDVDAGTEVVGISVVAGDVGADVVLGRAVVAGTT